MAGIKRKPDHEIPIVDENDLLKLTCLGAGNEVGRSSLLLEYKGKSILVSLDFVQQCLNPLMNTPIRPDSTFGIF
jgi:predicted metal-dependent RNase